MFDSVLWNYYDFKSLRINNHVERWHHRLNNDLNNVVYPYFYLFIRAIQNDYAYNSTISSRHLATGILPPRKRLFVNRNTRLRNLEERFKQPIRFNPTTGPIRIRSDFKRISVKPMNSCRNPGNDPPSDP